MIITKEKKFISAIVYARNCEKTIRSFLQMLIGELDANFENFEVVCVNDDSDDNSVDEITAVTNEIGNAAVVSIINLSYYQGLEAAINAGTDLAIGDFMFEFDVADNDFSPQTIMQVYRHALTGYDIVVASPTKNSNMTSKVFYSIMKRHSPVKTSMRTERFRLISRRAINRINILNNVIPYRKVIYNNCGLYSDAILYKPEKKIISQRSFKEKITLAINTLMLYTEYFSKVAVGFSTLMASITVCMGVYAIIVYSGNDKPIEGWTTTIAFLSFGFFGMFLILAIIIKYVSLKLKMQIKNGEYIFESIEKVKNDGA